MRILHRTRLILYFFDTDDAVGDRLLIAVLEFYLVALNLYRILVFFNRKLFNMVSNSLPIYICFLPIFNFVQFTFLQNNEILLLLFDCLFLFFFIIYISLIIIILHWDYNNIILNRPLWLRLLAFIYKLIFILRKQILISTRMYWFIIVDDNFYFCKFLFLLIDILDFGCSNFLFCLESMLIFIIVILSYGWLGWFILRKLSNFRLANISWSKNLTIGQVEILRLPI